MVNSAWEPEAGDQFLRQVFTIRQAEGRGGLGDGLLLLVSLSLSGEDRNAVSPAVRPGRSAGIRRRPVLAHRLTRQLQVDAMALVNEAIEDRIGERGLSEVGLPGVHRQLARDERRAGIDAIVEDFQQIRAILRRERRDPSRRAR
jgi:hypothetical protein